MYYYILIVVIFLIFLAVASRIGEFMVELYARNKKSQKKMDAEANLLTMPYLPWKLIMKDLDIPAIIEMGLIWSRIYSQIRMNKQPVSNLKFIILPGHYVINIITGVPNEEKLIFRIGESRAAFSPANINGRRVPLSRNGRIFTLKCNGSSEEKMAVFADLTHVLLEMLKVDHVDYLSCSFTGFVFDRVKKFRDFELTAPELSMDQVKMIFDKLEVDNFMLNNERVVPRFEPYPMKLKHRRMRLSHISWIPFTSILQMKCERLTFRPSTHRPDYTFDDFMMFIKTWLDNGVPNVTFLRAPPNSRETDLRLNHQHLLSNIDGVFLNESGHVMARRNDGKLARISLDQDIFKFRIIA